ncbi:MAG TPA: hypothetical protein VIM74_07355 [Casimicrobiaceae bacterium]
MHGLLVAAQRKTTGAFIAAVAGKAALGQNGVNVAREIDGGLCRGENSRQQE